MTGAAGGIELVNANERLIAGDAGRLWFVNPMNRTRGDLKVA